MILDFVLLLGLPLIAVALALILYYALDAILAGVRRII